ncbi:unnamed protein product [Fraxinus pennsylvanica]|uniref:Uncharacterized protein n=1 Tax=Fraxinus pennsylvanica TaxID=56036 RepID=A0AAD1YS97_9LAMI|nr:unnamed protein product [Fraxinus pennsylvanica]
MSLNCLPRQRSDLNKEHSNIFNLEKSNFSLCLGRVERTWSGDLEPSSSYDKIRSGSNLGPANNAKNGGGPTPFETGVATPRLVRSSGMRRDWSFEDATCCRERVVLVAVYVERPRRRLPSSNYHHQRHFHQANLAAGGRRYNRRAELLDYARDLRTSARSGASSPVHSSSNIIQPRAVQITPTRRKTRKTFAPTCLGKWKLLLPSFLTSMTASKTLKMKKKNKDKNSVSIITKITTVVKRLQMKKKKSFFSKLFATMRDHH